MPRNYALLTILFFTSVFFTSLTASGQSLGDIARANRDKQNQANASASQPTVITTDDLEPGSTGVPSATASKPSKVPSDKRSTASQGRPNGEQVDPKLAAEWKRKIVAQKNKVLTLQAQVNQLNAQIHPPGGAEFDGPANRDQARRMQRVAEIQVQLDEQKRTLTEMQEEARRAGMHTAVYDP